MIYKYTKVTDEFTTYCLAEPEGEERVVTELATVDGTTYVYAPDEVTLPPQPEQITVEEVTLTDELKEAIKAASPHVQLINERVVNKIRELYSVNDEIKLIRLAPSVESEAYNDYVEACRDWGTAEKAKIGL
jgi:hypothetical protein